jgi:hypothetical protein
MEIDDRELANILERFMAKWSNDNKSEYGVIEEIYPTNKDFLEYARKIIKDIRNIKREWVV